MSRSTLQDALAGLDLPALLHQLQRRLKRRFATRLVALAWRQEGTWRVVSSPAEGLAGVGPGQAPLLAELGAPRLLRSLDPAGGPAERWWYSCGLRGALLSPLGERGAALLVGFSEPVDHLGEPEVERIVGLLEAAREPALAGLPEEVRAPRPAAPPQAAPTSAPPPAPSVGAGGIASEGAPGLWSTMEEVERWHLTRVLTAVGWRISGPSGAARVLGLHPNTLRSRLTRLGLTRPRPPGS